MNNQRPYKHILKNLFHEQATEIIPLLWPEYRVEEVLDVEMPELRSIPDEGPIGELHKGLAKLALPEAEVIRSYRTEWIEHSGKFERAYRAYSTKLEQSIYLVIEFQTEPKDEDLPRDLLANYVHIVIEYAREDKKQYQGEGTVVIVNALPIVLCPFPQGVPAPIRDTLNGRVMQEFNFEVLGLWEKDARELLNTHVSALYFLLPAMKNADAPLLGLAIEELAQRFRNDELELGRHLTGLSLLLHQSEVMSQEEKLLAREHLRRFAHLLKDDAEDE